MIKISAVIITYNEERNIGRCLESLKEVVDEIVVVDSYSTDRTEEICRSYNAKFIKHEFEGYIHQKNWAITQATYPHILSLDADEALSEELTRSIKEVSRNWKYDGYKFKRLTSFCNKWIRHNSWYPSHKLRLVDSRKGSWGGLDPHDTYVMNSNAKIGNLKGDLLHYSHYTIEDLNKQAGRFSTILANSFLEYGKKGTIIDITFRPFWRFFRDYIIKLGFLDGLYGFIICINSANEVFLKYSKLKHLQKDIPGKSDRNICFFNTNKEWGGGEKWTYDIATEFKIKGYNVLIIANTGSELEKRALRTNIKTVGLKIRNTSFLNGFIKRRVKRILHANRINTIFINLSIDLKVAGSVSKSLEIKHIIYRRGLSIPIGRNLYNRYLLRSVPSLILTNSEETKKGVLKNYRNELDLNKIRVMHNCIKLNSYPPLPNKNNKLIIGSAGRLSREKGHIYLIELAKILQEKGIPFEIQIAGDGKCREQLITEIQKYSLGNVVKLLGFLNDMDDFYKEIDVFVLPSEWEGFGFVLVEAMSFYKPVFAFDTGSSSEIIDDGINGYIIEKFNLDDLADKIIQLHNYEDLRLMMGKAARRKVESNFSFNTLVQKLEEIIR